MESAEDEGSPRPSSDRSRPCALHPPESKRDDATLERLEDSAGCGASCSAAVRTVPVRDRIGECAQPGGIVVGGGERRVRAQRGRGGAREERPWWSTRREAVVEHAQRGRSGSPVRRASDQSRGWSHRSPRPARKARQSYARSTCGIRAQHARGACFVSRARVRSQCARVWVTACAASGTPRSSATYATLRQPTHTRADVIILEASGLLLQGYSERQNRYRGQQGRRKVVGKVGR
eukprot:4863554-Pleurochrysis_carterae.AAC.1